MKVTIKELKRHGINDWHRWRAYRKLHPGHTLSDDAHQLLREHENKKYH